MYKKSFDQESLHIYQIRDKDDRAYSITGELTNQPELIACAHHLPGLMNVHPTLVDSVIKALFWTITA